MSNFIREPWIHSLLCAQLYQNAIPSTSQRCQLVDVVGKADALEVIVSDRVHSITAVLSGESTANFKKIYALDWVDVKGCLMTLDRFYFDYSFEKNAFFIYTEDFSYFGSEGEVIGDPVSVNHAKDIKEVLGHDICRRLHIGELDPLYCVVERETSERRRALDLILRDTVGAHTEAHNRRPNGGENTAALPKHGDFVDTGAYMAEASQDQACEAIAARSEDQAASLAQNDAGIFCEVSCSSAASMTTCVSSKEDCTASSSNEQHSLQKEGSAEGGVSKEDAAHASERPDCRKTDEPALSRCDATSRTVLPSPVCCKKEKGVIDFRDISPTANFDLSIFTRRRKSRTADNSTT